MMNYFAYNKSIILRLVMKNTNKILAKLNNWVLELFLVIISIILSLFLINYNDVKAQSIPQIPSELIEASWDKIIKIESPKSDIKTSFLYKKLVPNIIKLLFFLWSSIAVLAIFYSWYKILTSFWDSKRYKSWWDIFAYTIWWVFIMFFSRWIVWIIENINISDTHVSWSDFNIDSSTSINNLPSWEFESELIPNIIWIWVSLVWLIIIILMIYSWIMYVTSVLWWSDKNRDKSKDIFIDTLIWLVVLLASYSFVQWLFKINFWN